MNEYLAITLKTLLFLTIILIIIRIMGKRELGQLNVFDIIVSFMISEIFSNAIADANSNVFLTLLPILIIFIIQISISFIVLHNNKMRNIIESTPSLIINKGKLDYDEMKKQRYNISDLLQQIHQQGIDDIRTIHFAILENNGSLSIIKKDESKLLFPYPIINDGKLDFEIIKQIDNIDINHLLKNITYKLEDIFMAFIDANNQLVVFSKEGNK